MTGITAALGKMKRVLGRLAPSMYAMSAQPSAESPKPWSMTKVDLCGALVGPMTSGSGCCVDIAVVIEL